MTTDSNTIRIYIEPDVLLDELSLRYWEIEDRIRATYPERYEQYREEIFSVYCCLWAHRIKDGGFTDRPFAPMETVDNDVLCRTDVIFPEDSNYKELYALAVGEGRGGRKVLAKSGHLILLSVTREEEEERQETEL